MFRTIACWPTQSHNDTKSHTFDVIANNLFKQHPLILTEMLEVAWDRAITQQGGKLMRSSFPGISRGILSSYLSSPEDLIKAVSIAQTTLEGIEKGGNLPLLLDQIYHFFYDTTDQSQGYPEVRLWRHLIYAYMVENTGIYEIFRRVVDKFAYGEELGVAEPDAQLWLRNTEELFYRDLPPFHILSITSHIRPDLAATRRNAYQRMFGMGLNHGGDNSKPFYPYVPYVKAEAANTRFVSTFEEFLREVWIGIQNYKNTSGTNPTDKGRIADLAKTLHEMLTARRQHGNLSREEFVFVSMMEWFHLTVEFNSPIVETLRADASDPAQRLFKIAERVGVPAHKQGVRH